MTEDWRKALGLDDVEQDEVVEYKGQLYVNGQKVDNLKGNLKLKTNVSGETLFVSEFLIFSKPLSAYRIKRSLEDYELDLLSDKDQKKYKELDDEVEEILQQYLRDGSDELSIKLNKKFKDLLLILVKFLKSKKIVSLDANKIVDKYSKIPFIGKIPDDISKAKSNYKSVLKYEYLKKNKVLKIKKEKKTIINENIEDTSNINIKESNRDGDLINKIKRLKRLYKNGTLDKEEFEKAKNKLLR